MRQPQTRAGQVWISEYFNGLRQFMLSNRSDAGAFERAVQALRSLLEREPDYAREVGQLALQCAAGAYNAGFPETMENLAGVGLDAEFMGSGAATEPAVPALLLLYLAESQLEDGRRLEGLGTLERITERVGEAADDPLLAYVRARGLLLRAELNELGRETERARKEFQESAAAASGILRDEGRLRDFRERFLAAVYGPEDSTTGAQLNALESSAVYMVEFVYVSAMLGAARVIPESSGDYAAIAAETRKAITKYGYLKGSSPFFLIDLLGNMPPKDAGEFGAWLAESQTGGEHLFDKLKVDDLAPELRETLRKAYEQRQDATRARDENIWQVATRLGLARSQEKSGDIEGAQASYTAAMGLALQGRLALPQALAAGLLVASLAEHDPERAEGMSKVFLIAYEGTVGKDPAVFHEPRYRALFDRPIAALIDLRLGSDEALRDKSARREASVLLDLLRTNVLPPPGVFTADLRKDEPTASELGLLEVSDTLGRITEALAGREGVAALITHGGGSGTVFVLIDGEGMFAERDGGGFAEAVRALEGAAAGALMSAQAGISGKSQAGLESAGRKAFDALPPRARAALGSARTILIAPDFRVNHDVIPFELLHDGDDFLLASKAVARFTSLRHLARTLDTRLERPPRSRALVVAAPNVEGYEPLFSAKPECDDVRAQLLSAGFDSPEISEGRLTPSFFVDRLSYVDVLHLAAHGESEAATEYVVLPQGRRVGVDDLQRKRQRSLPFVYLNTCQLGETRYLGGGQYRGLAFTLSELGAPSVIANTTDVLDDISSELTRIFYREAVARPVGDALREARRQLIEGGRPPILVARVILLGNPWHSIKGEDGGRVKEDPACDLLDAFFEGHDPALAEPAWAEAARRVTEDGGPVRLGAAMLLIQGESDAEQKKDSPGWAVESGGVIALADALEHSGAQALLRYTRARTGLMRGDPKSLARLEDCVPYLKAREGFGPIWSRLLTDARATLRKAEMAKQGLGVQRHGPGSEEPDEAVEALLDAMLASQAGAEEETGATRLRDTEKSLEDITWNAVVIGHPNRFEDVGDATRYAALLARKLVERGHLPEACEPHAAALLVGLLWFLWSSQNVTYLAPEMAEGQAGALRELIRDVAEHWSPPDGEPFYVLVRDFPEKVGEALAYLDGLPYESVHQGIKERLGGLGGEAKELLSRVGEQFPEALPSCTAFVTGTLAVRNTYSPLDGSVPEDMQKKLADAVWSLDLENEGRFYPYLMRGFEAVRAREPDELERWRLEQSSS